MRARSAAEAVRSPHYMTPPYFTSRIFGHSNLPQEDEQVDLIADFREGPLEVMPKLLAIIRKSKEGCANRNELINVRMADVTRKQLTHAISSLPLFIRRI